MCFFWSVLYHSNEGANQNRESFELFVLHQAPAKYDFRVFYKVCKEFLGAFPAPMLSLGRAVWTSVSPCAPVCHNLNTERRGLDCVHNELLCLKNAGSLTTFVKPAPLSAVCHCFQMHTSSLGQSVTRNQRNCVSSQHYLNEYSPETNLRRMWISPDRTSIIEKSLRSRGGKKRKRI